ncbi:MAG: polyprenol monophosphomannose synthase, partial [Actinomycetota bacterium]|nr:polyprenol monophosphomannose synthase [Actinomycetota bacterium]
MRALVVVPTYDEAATVERVVQGVLACGGDAGPAEVLVVDDASPDGTGAVAGRLARRDERVHVLHRSRRSGLGGAYRDGFGWGLSRGYAALCQMDADLSHDPADLPRLLRALRGADLVVGSRYVPTGDVADWSPARVALSRGANHAVRLLTGLPVRDATSGFRAFRRPVLETLVPGSVRSDGYAFQVEMALRTWREGFRVVEVPIVFVERRAGSSKLTWAVAAEAAARLPLWAMRWPRHAPPAHARSVA